MALVHKPRSSLIMMIGTIRDVGPSLRDKGRRGLVNLRGASDKTHE